MKRLMFCLIFLSVPAFVHAQAPVVQPPVTAIRVVISGGVSPVTNDLPLSSWSQATCDTSSGTIVNPTRFQYKVLTTDTQCWTYTDPGNGPLLSLPVGGTTYTATSAYVNTNGAGPASNVSNPFSKPGVAPSTAPAVFRSAP